jgi:hypothetical protein
MIVVREFPGLSSAYRCIECVRFGSAAAICYAPRVSTSANCYADDGQVRRETDFVQIVGSKPGS